MDIYSIIPKDKEILIQEEKPREMLMDPILLTIWYHKKSTCIWLSIL